MKYLVNQIEDNLLKNLFDKCDKFINKSIDNFELLFNELDKSSENDIRVIFRQIRRNIINLQLIEYYGISALYYQPNDFKFLNQLINVIHDELHLPVEPPLATCISTKYYYYHPLTNVIFMPIGESNSLLHLPDIFHEIGHEILFYRKDNPSLVGIDHSYNEGINIINNYYGDLLTSKKRETGPKTISSVIEIIHSNWKNNWINEYFCDLFACYFLGPAYAWAHLFLTLKNSDNIYKFFIKSHPSDDSRLSFLISVLKFLGFYEEAELILSKWNEMPLALNIKPENEYKYAYSDKLLEPLADLFIDGLKKCNLIPITPQKLKKLTDKSVVKLLNEAWSYFISKPYKYSEWEKSKIKNLKSSF